MFYLHHCVGLNRVLDKMMHTLLIHKLQIQILGTKYFHHLILVKANTTFIFRSESPRMGKGIHPLRSGVCRIDGMFIGGHRSGEWVGVQPEGEFFLLNPWLCPLLVPPPPLSVRALLRGRETLSTALPHLGPNAHCGIVLASGDRRVGWGGGIQGRIQ